jgi:hypothetical protein
MEELRERVEKATYLINPRPTNSDQYERIVDHLYRASYIEDVTMDEINFDEEKGTITFEARVNEGFGESGVSSTCLVPQCSFGGSATTGLCSVCTRTYGVATDEMRRLRDVRIQELDEKLDHRIHELMISLVPDTLELEYCFEEADRVISTLTRIS